MGLSTQSSRQIGGRIAIHGAKMASAKGLRGWHLAKAPFRQIAAAIGSSDLYDGPVCIVTPAPPGRRMDDVDSSNALSMLFEISDSARASHFGLDARQARMSIKREREGLRNHFRRTRGVR